MRKVGKPDGCGVGFYFRNTNALIESCSKGLISNFWRAKKRDGLVSWRNEADDDHYPNWDAYAHHSRADNKRSTIVVAE